MKYLVTICLIISAIAVRAQLVESDKMVADLGQHGDVIRIIQSGQTHEYSIYFNNKEYQVLTDVNHIDIGTKEDFLKFVEAMKAVDLGHDYENPQYFISCYRGGFNGALWIKVFAPGNQGYFYLSKKRIEKFQEVVNKLK